MAKRKRDTFVGVYEKAISLSKKAQEGEISVEEMMRETEAYGKQMLKLYDEMLMLLRQIDTRIDGLEEAVRNR